MKDRLILWAVLSVIFYLASFAIWPSAKAVNRNAGYSACLHDRSQDFIICLIKWKYSEAEAVAKTKMFLDDCRKVAAHDPPYGNAARDYRKFCFDLTEHANNRWKEGFPK